MKKLLLAAMLLLSVGFTKLQAQNLPGFQTGNCTGVNGVFFNPANIADSRYKWDVNLFSFNGYIGNNKADFNFKDLAATNMDKFKNNFLQGNGNANASTNAQIVGPSAMFNLNKKSSMAISTRLRVIGNLKDFDGNLINSFINAGNPTSSFTLSTNSNSQLVTNAWGEYGLSYAREIASFGPHYIKAGITVKYLSGMSNNFLQINKFKTTINADTFSQRAYFQNSSGIIQIANSGLSSGTTNFEKFFGSDSKGIGGDIGIVYEYRPNVENTGMFTKYRVENKYKFKVGLSLIDIGSIKYKTNFENSASYNIHISGNQRFYLDQVTNSSIKQLKAKFDANPALFTNIADNSGSYSASLPTILQADVDYHLSRGFYISAGGQLNVVSKTNLYSSNQYNSLTLTPRYEGKSFGVYFPLNYSELTQFNAGLSLRAGPLFIGSGSLFTAIVKSKQADFHVGLHIGILQKAKKDAVVKIIETLTTPVITVAAVSPDRNVEGN